LNGRRIGGNETMKSFRDEGRKGRGGGGRTNIIGERGNKLCIHDILKTGVYKKI
jgi:hypothetical protein